MSMDEDCKKEKDVDDYIKTCVVKKQVISISDFFFFFKYIFRKLPLKMSVEVLV